MEQYKLLQLKTPRIGMIHLSNVNSDFCYNADRCKNCYLLANTVDNEDCMYGRDFYHNRDCVDCDHVFRCTLCYETINCKNCYNCNHMQDSESSSDCLYGYDLRGCINCTGCASLRNKEYCLFNEQLSPSVYREKVALLKSEEIRKKFDEVKEKTPRVYSVSTNSENFIGNYVHHCKNAYEAFDTVECQDVGYVSEIKSCKDCWDIFVLEYSELCYNISSCHKMYNCNCCFFSAESKDCEYSELMLNSEHCFGCVSLHHKKYHILNKPYSEEEYFKEVARLKEEMKKEGILGELWMPPTYPLEDTVAAWDVM